MGISLQSFAKLNRRLNQPPKAAGNGDPASLSPPQPAYRTILGIDPSLRGTGFGVIRIEDREPRFVEAGTIRCPQLPLSESLIQIANELSAVVRKTRPEVCVVEGLFFAQNRKTVLIMGQVRGVCIYSIGQAEIPVHEIAPRRVKLAITGRGGAQKLAVAKMVERLLKLDRTPESDAADALALALTFHLESQSPSNQTIPRI